MCVILFLKSLFASRVYIVTSSCNDVVTAVCGGVPYRLVLAHKEDRDGGSDAPEGARISTDVDKVPCSRVSEASLRDVS